MFPQKPRKPRPRIGETRADEIEKKDKYKSALKRYKYDVIKYISRFLTREKIVSYKSYKDSQSCLYCEHESFNGLIFKDSDSQSFICADCLDYLLPNRFFQHRRSRNCNENPKYIELTALDAYENLVDENTLVNNIDSNELSKYVYADHIETATIRTQGKELKLHVRRSAICYENRVANKPSISLILSRIRGGNCRRVYNTFQCVVCNQKKSWGKEYFISWVNNTTFKICEECELKLLTKNQFIKLIYTPMGNKR